MIGLFTTRATRMAAALAAALVLGGMALAAPSPIAPAPIAAPAGAALNTPLPAPAPKPAGTHAPASPSPAVELPPSPELEGFVDGMVRDAMASDHIAGVTVSVVRGGQVVLKKGYGYASLSPARPVDPDRTMFRIGSITKTFTWILALKEVEAGHMRLDAPINLYLPEKLQVRDGGYEQQVQLQHLMSHTAGFEDRALGQIFERDARRERSLSLYLSQERPARVRPPGLVPAYSNYGAALAGAAVANVRGQPIETLAESDIFRPLGMGYSSLREPRPAMEGLPAPLSPALAGDLSTAFRWQDGGFEARPFEYAGHLAPAGSGSSTAGDMARYMLALLGGGTHDGATIFGPATAAAMRSTHFRGAPGAAGWNHGFMDYPLPGGRRGFGHEGDTFAFHSNMVLVPSLDLGIFVAVNTEGGAGLPARLPGAIVQRFYAPPAQPMAPNSALVGLKRLYEGRYLSTRRAYVGLEGFVTRLNAGMTAKVTPEGYLVTHTTNGQRRWAPDGDPTQGRFRAVDGPDSLIFVMARGRAERAIAPWGGEAYERAGLLDDASLLAPLAFFAALTALTTLGGIFFRNRRDFRQTTEQSRAQLMQSFQALLLLIAMVSLAVFASSAGDVPELVFNWPNGWMRTASACALVATILALATVIMLPWVWRGGRRLDSWNAWRKLRFTGTTLLFSALGLLLGFQGALQSWR